MWNKTERSFFFEHKDCFNYDAKRAALITFLCIRNGTGRRVNDMYVCM